MKIKLILPKLLFYIIVAPLFLWLIMHPAKLLKEVSLFPGYVKANISTFFAEDKLAKINEARWNAFGPDREDIFSKVYYGKGYLLAENFFNYLTYFSPRYYFQSGDGGNFANSKSEPVAIPLFVFWVLGIIYLVRAKKFKKFLWVAIFAFIAFIAGKRNFAYLFPIAILYISIAIDGIENTFNLKTRRIIYTLISLYGLYILSRIFLI